MYERPEVTVTGVVSPERVIVLITYKSYMSYSWFLLDLIGSTSRVMMASSSTIDAANGAMNNMTNDTSGVELAFNDTRDKVGSVMRLAVTVVDTISNSLLNFTEVGDPITQLEIDDVTVQVAKATVSDVDNSTVDTRQGSLKLPPIASLIDVSPDECVQRRVRSGLLWSTISAIFWVN